MTTGPHTMTKDELLALADRVEREEPTWELTCEIEIALKPNARRSSNALYAVRSGLGMYNPPAYLHSLDAAVTLVPAGAWWNVQVYRGCSDAMVSCDGNEDRPDLDSEASATTPAAALTAAALRARAADMQARAVPSPEQKGSEQ